MTTRPATGRPSLVIDHQRVERQKQFRRDLWEYRPVDHIPVTFWPSWTFGHTPRETTENGDIQLEVNVRTIERSLRIIPDDYIPWARVWSGYMTIATMFGADVHWGDDPAQPPGVRSPLITEIEQVYRLARPDMGAGVMPENLRRLRQHAASLPPDLERVRGQHALGAITCSRLTRAQQEELGDPMIRSNVGVDGAATEG